jgi:ATP-dependent Clp protease ATP-binding subunit ClpC
MFERYTEPARRVVFFSRYEATQRGSDRITTGHLLLGLIREKDSRADAVGSLRTKLPDPCDLLGIPHGPVTQIPYDKKIGPPLDINSKKALAYAAQEADLDQEYWIDTDHLLRSLLCFPNEASPALESIQLDLASVRAASKHHRAEHPPKRKPIFGRTGILFRRFRMALLKLAIFALAMVLANILVRLLNH